MCNLLNSLTPNEEILIQGLNELLGLTSSIFEEKGIKLNYEFFDYHLQCKKGTSLLEEFIRKVIR
jgi:hypothetical protein